jgi:hypothetical protein
MRQLWICFRCLFHASSVTQQQFTIPCVRHDSNFAIESMCRPWLYFCYRFHAWAMNYLTLSIQYVSYNSAFSDDFKVYSDSIFADDLWISSDIAFFTIPCVSHDSIFAIDLMRRSWILWRCRFHMAAVTQYSLTISCSTETLFSLTIYRLVVTKRFWQFHASAMIVNSLTLSIPYVSCHSVLSDDF